MDILQYLKSYPLNSPQILDLFMRSNLARSAPRELYLFPDLVPVFVANPSGFSPIIQWYDRNPKNVFNFYGVPGVAPHAETERWIYTVPTGKKAFVEVAMLKVLRWTASTLVNWAGASIHYLPAGGVDHPLIDAWLFASALGTMETVILGQSLLMFSGDVLRGLTADSNADGTVYYFLSSKITEFDA